jgi:hypothetical protein
VEIPSSFNFFSVTSPTPLISLTLSLTLMAVFL